MKVKTGILIALVSSLVLCFLPADVFESFRSPRMCLLCHVAGLDQLKYVVEGLLLEEMIMKNANNSDHWNERKGHRDPRFTLSIVDRGFIWCESCLFDTLNNFRLSTTFRRPSDSQLTFYHFLTP